MLLLSTMAGVRLRISLIRLLLEEMGLLQVTHCSREGGLGQRHGAV